MKAVIPIDLVRLAVKLAKIVRTPREDLLEIDEKKRENAASYYHLYQASMKARHEC